MFKVLLTLILFAAPHSLPNNYSVQYYNRDGNFAKADLVRSNKKHKVLDKFRLLCKCGDKDADCMKAYWPGDPMTEYSKDDTALVDWICHVPPHGKVENIWYQ